MINKNMFEYLKRSALRRRWRIAVLFVILSAIAVLFVRTLKTPYQAELRMLVTSKSEPMSMASFGLDSGMSSIDSKSQITRQDILLESHRVYEYMLENSKYMHSGEIAEQPVKKIFDLQVLQSALFGRDYVEARKKFSKQDFLSFKSNIVFRREQDTPSFFVGFVHADPEVALAMSLELADALIAVNRSLAKSSSRDVAEFLENKVAEIQDQAEVQSEKIASFMKSEKFPNSSAIIESRYKGYLDAQQQLLAESAKIKLTKMLIEKTKRYVTRLKSIFAETISDTSNDTRIARLIAEIRSYEKEFENIDENNDRVREEAQQLRGLRLKLEEKIQKKTTIFGREALNQMVLDSERRISDFEAELLTGMQNYSLIRDEAARFGRDIEKLPSLQADLQKLLSKQESLNSTLKVLEERYFEVLIKQDSDLTNLAVIDKPVLTSSLRSNKSQILSIGVIAALAIALVLFVLIDLVNMVIYDPSQMSQSNVGYLGTLPHFTQEEVGAGLWTHESVSVLVHELRRGIDSGRSSAAGARILTFVSSDRGAGKSIASISFAMGLARKGQRVLLIDGDYRAANREGLRLYAPAILGKDFDQTIDQLDVGKKSAVNQIGVAAQVYLASVFPKTEEHQEYSAIFSKKLLNNIQEVSQQFDYILVDMPPLFFTDTLEVISFVDGVVLCIREGVEHLNTFNSSIATISKHKREGTKVFSVITDSHYNEAQKRNRYYYFKRKGAA